MAVPRGMVMSVMALGVRQAQPLAEASHFPVDLRANHDMPVIRQKTIREQFDWRQCQCLDHHPLEGLEVLRHVKKRLPPIASVEHVINAVRLIRPGWSPHATASKAAENTSRNLPSQP